MRIALLFAAALCLAACQPASEPAADAPAPEPAVEPEQTAPSNAERLAAVLAALPEDAQARYQYRHPAETLAFFEVEPGMTVVEGLPGGGWYSKVLLPYLGGDGHLIGADYAQEIWSLFGFFDDEFIEARKPFVEEFPVNAQAWRGDDGASVAAFKFGSMPAEMQGTADRVLLIRALHNLNRFEGQGGFLTATLADTYSVLKPGGIVGVVQHQAPDSSAEESVDGSRGYLKKANVIALMQDGGFEYLGEIAINENPNDQPTDEDIVWRLPPTYLNNRDDPELKAAVDAVGESNRMTLKFRKPE